MAPLESVIDPFASVRLPRVEPVAAVIVPVVVRFSSLKVIAPLESVIDPFASVRLPIVVPEPAEMAPRNVVEPETFNVPSTISPSLMFIVAESVELNVVPFICMAPNITFPVPAGLMLMSSFDLMPSMLLSLILKAGNSTPPVPEGWNTRSSLDLVADISLPTKDISPADKGERYNSVKFSFTLFIATRKLSPVPSFAFDPMFSVCCAIFILLLSFLQPQCHGHLYYLSHLSVLNFHCQCLLRW